MATNEGLYGNPGKRFENKKGEKQLNRLNSSRWGK